VVDFIFFNQPIASFILNMIFKNLFSQLQMKIKSYLMEQNIITAIKIYYRSFGDKFPMQNSITLNSALMYGGSNQIHIFSFLRIPNYFRSPIRYTARPTIQPFFRSSDAKFP